MMKNYSLLALQNLSKNRLFSAIKIFGLGLSMGECLIILLLMVFCSGQLYSQYNPMVNEAKFWIYRRYYSNDKPNIASGHLIRFKGDTVIHNTTYKLVWKEELSGSHPCPIEQRPCFTFDQPYQAISETLVGYIREEIDEKKVYFKPISGTYCGEDEYTLFDFSLDVNDMLDSCKTAALGSQANFGAIDSISNLLYFGLSRTVFHTTGFISTIGLQYKGKVNLIESVGYENYGLFHEPNNLNYLHEYCEGNLSNCYIVSSVQQSNIMEEISVYPNPAGNIVYFNEKMEVNSIRAHDLRGQIKDLTHEDNSFALNDLTAGFYILEFNGVDGKKYMAKIIKE